MQNVPVLILTASDSLDPAGPPRASDAALVLLVGFYLFAANIGTGPTWQKARRKIAG